MTDDQCQKHLMENFDWIIARACLKMADLFRVDSMVRGYHVYNNIWDASSDVGEELICKREPGNRVDTHAVAITKDDVTVGHVPRAISPICSIFIRRGGTIKCLIIGGRRYSSDLPQGGLEIPCVLTFETTNAKEGMKTQRVLDNAGYKVCLGSQQQDSDGSSDVFEGCSTQTVAAIPIHPCAVELTTKDVQVQSITERFVDTEHIIMGEKLNDEDINHAQKILKAQFPKLNGLRLTLYQDKPSEQATDNWVQVIHCLRRDHWILATTINCDDVVLIYDSVFRNVDEPTKSVLYNVFPSSTRVKVSGKAQKQTGGNDCGVFALAFATSLAFGMDPASQIYEQDRMRLHLANCFKVNKFSQFPRRQD